jgi:hypothetical protein
MSDFISNPALEGENDRVESAPSHTKQHLAASRSKQIFRSRRLDNHLRRLWAKVEKKARSSGPS